MKFLEIVTSVFDIAARFVLLALSIASFEPQLRKITKQDNCNGISLWALVLNLTIATYNFSLALDLVAIDREPISPDGQLPGIGDWLNLAQFGAVTIGHLVIFYHALNLLPSRPTTKAATGLAYCAFLAISVVPIVFSATMTEHEREWFAPILVGRLLFFGGPLVQILALVAPCIQAWNIVKVRSVGAISLQTLRAQALVFLFVGISFMWRLQLPAEYWKCPEEDPECASREAQWRFALGNGLRQWYWSVGWATINNLIFAVGQGTLLGVASRYGKTESEELEPLLEGRGVLASDRATEAA